MDDYLITIFTPTFNRASLLARVYESLIRQSKKEFVWLIVDDGSTDNTSSIIQNWEKEKVLNIKYVFQVNSGKMKAHNRAVCECQTELFMCLDSDDYLSDDCIEKIYLYWPKFKSNPKVSGMVAYRKMIGRTQYFFPDVELSTLHNLYKTYVGETALTFRTSILREYQFIEVDGEKFIGEGIVYDKLDQKYILAVIPEYWIFCEYQEDGYTNKALSILINNPKGWSLNAKQKYELYGCSWKEKIRWMSTYICASLFAGYKLKYIFIHSPNKILSILCLPLGWLQKTYNKQRERK